MNITKTIHDNGIITKPNQYRILHTGCLSSCHKALIPGVQKGNCQCGNCKVRIRQYRFHKNGALGDKSYHDYVYDKEEVIEIESQLIPNK